MNRQGQSCSSTSRVFVHRNIHNEVVEELKNLVKKLPVGLPWIERNEVGPVVSQRQYDKIMDFISSAAEEWGNLGFRRRFSEGRTPLEWFFHSADCLQQCKTRDADCKGRNFWTCDVCLRME